MVWFSCGDCGDSIRKPKLQSHFNSCTASCLTCIDCCQDFDKAGAQGHVTCVTEHQKYALGATKPGGFASSGFTNGQNIKGGSNAPTGLQYLTEQPPWKCSLCNVSCSSRETLLGHAAGQKHARKVKAAANTVQAVNGAAAAEGPAAAKAAPAPDTATSSGGPSLHSTPSAGRTNGKRDDEGNAGLRGDKKKAAGLAEAEREGGGRSGVGSGAEASRRGQGSGSQAAEKPSSTVGQSQASSKEKRKGGKRKEGAASQQWPDAGPVAVVAKRQKTEDGKAALVARASAGASPKWKKLAIAALRDKGGRMKIKKLQKALLKQTGLSPNDEIQAGLMLRKWVKCPKLTVLDDGYIELHSGS